MKVENVAPGSEGLAGADGKTGTTCGRSQSLPLRRRASRNGSQRGEVCRFVRRHKMDGHRGRQLRQVLSAGRQSVLPVPTALRTTRRSQLKRLAVINDLQMALLALPEMTVGENSFTYTDKSSGERNRIAHEWVERSTSKPPRPRRRSIRPMAARPRAPTSLAGACRRDPDGDGSPTTTSCSPTGKICGGLSTNFDKLISRTADKGKDTLPCTGLLTGGKTYYCQCVRAKDEKGVWGLWSKTFSHAAGRRIPAGGAARLRQGQGNRHPGSGRPTRPARSR